LINNITVSKEVAKDKIRPGQNVQVESLFTRNRDRLIHIFLNSDEDQYSIKEFKNRRITEGIF
jgi:hypothetical protein